MLKSVRIAPCLLTALLVLFAGCSTTAPKPLAPDETASEATADALLEQAWSSAAIGNLVIAAQLHLQLAEQSDSPEKETNLLAAADILVRGQHLEKTRAILDKLDPGQLTPEQTLRYRMVLARMALQEENVDNALEQLRYPADETLPREQQVEWLTLKAEVYSRIGDHIAAARQRITLEPLLDDDITIQRNHQLIWLALGHLTAPALATLRDQPPPDIFSGWVELAYFAKISEQSPKQFEAQLQQWQTRYPEHPAQGEFIEGLASMQQMLHFRPDNIALLLPLSGNFSAPANAVRDGFLAAYYAREDDSYTPNIRIYDTTDNVDTGLFIYQRAIAEGADFIVGPLHKPLVEALANEEKIPVTTLALNYLSAEDIYVENLYQYGLLPEDEARQVAERAWLDGHDNALALAPEGEWGDRMLATFEKHWRQLDGRVLEVQRYNPGKHDFAGPVVDLLNIDQSKQRHRDVQKTVRLTLVTEARRRQDIDFIFVAAFPQQARQIRPQLKFYYASDIPIYSTSHAYGGEINTTLDRDMNGITFCDMPWVFTGGAGQAPQWRDIADIWKSDATPFKRLYAMGIDAYRLIFLLPRFEAGLEYFSAQTGSLYLDGVNRFHRQLLWANFRNGKPRLIDPAPPPGPPPS